MTADDVSSLRLLSRRITVALVVVAVVGMTFTAVSVTLFAIDHGVSPWIAWTLDPMVAVALLVVLVADARLVELGVSPGGWPRVLRWFAGMATWAMNAWQSVWPDDGFGVPRQIDPAGVVLHSVAPVLLIVLAEAVTGYRRVIADRIRVLEGGAQCARPDSVEPATLTGSPNRPRIEGGPQHGHPSLEVVVDDHVRGAAEMVAPEDQVLHRAREMQHLEDAPSSWDQPWRAPWDTDPEGWASKTQVQPWSEGWTCKTHVRLPGEEASQHQEASVVGPFGGPANDHLDDRPDFLRLPSNAVVPVVAGWSSGPVRNDRRHDHLDDQAHDHPGTSWDRGEMVAPVVADPLISVAPAATQADHLDDQDAELFRGSPENLVHHLDSQAGSVTVADAIVVQATKVADPNRGRTATVGEGYASVRTPEAGSQGDANASPAPNPVVAGNAASTLTVADLPQSQPELSDADLRRAAKKLQREAVRSTGRPVTVDALRDGLGLSRRRAVALRREVVGVSS